MVFLIYFSPFLTQQALLFNTPDQQEAIYSTISFSLQGFLVLYARKQIVKNKRRLRSLESFNSSRVFPKPFQSLRSMGRDGRCFQPLRGFLSSGSHYDDLSIPLPSQRESISDLQRGCSLPAQEILSILF